MPQTHFRPCIDLHEGKVKQIVGASLNDCDASSLQTNHVSSHSAAYFAGLYKEKNLSGAHVIKLGQGNDAAAKEALAAWTGGLQIGGGITLKNADEWLKAGAGKIIVTSWLFPKATFSLDRLRLLREKIGKDRIVVDLSCRRKGDRWFVATDKWQTVTDFEVSKESLDLVAEHCSEFLVHAADVEGLCKGIDQDLVRKLGDWVTIPTTYAGGAHDISDLKLVQDLSHGKVDLTFGSSLDIFGGTQVKFDDCVRWNQEAISF